MPTDQQIVLLGALAGALVLVGILLSWSLTAPRLRGRPQSDLADHFGGKERLEVATDFVAGQDAAVQPRPILSTSTYDRVVRITGFTLLVSVLVAVGAGGQWRENATAIYLLVALGTMFLVVVQDLIPARWLGRGRFVVDAIGALAFVTGLSALTGGYDSPFVSGYFVIAVAAAFVGTARTALLVGVAAALVHIIVIAAVLGPVGPGQLTRLAFNLLALALLTSLAHVVGREQRRARDDALRLSIIDPLTGLFNRGHLLALVEREIRRAARTGRRFCMVMLDLDDLKPVNDTFGHQCGDRVLRAVADVLRSSVRGSDAPARYGGDEFIVLLPETDPTGAYVLAEKLRLAVNDLTVRVDARTLRSSASIGVVTFPEDGTNATELIASADAAMYEAKRLGKNKMVSYRREPVDVQRAAGTSELDRARAEQRGEGGDSPQGASFLEGPARAAQGERAGQATHSRISVTPLDGGGTRPDRRFQVVRLEDEGTTGPGWPSRTGGETRSRAGSVDRTE